MPQLVYYSSGSGNTARFMAQLGLPALRIPVRQDDPMPQPTKPFVLIIPTYADGEGKGAVHKQVIRFLNDPAKRGLLRGVIGGGNRNFGSTYGLAANVVSKKCEVPILYKFELAGTETDIARVHAGLEHFWGLECLTAP